MGLHCLPKTVCLSENLGSLRYFCSFEFIKFITGNCQNLQQCVFVPLFMLTFRIRLDGNLDDLVVLGGKNYIKK